MKQVTIRELRRSATEEMLKEPCEVTSDGKVIAVLTPYVAHRTEHGADVAQGTPRPALIRPAPIRVVPLSKERQVSKRGFND